MLAALSFSRAGLAAAWRHEAAFRQEVVALCVLLPGAIWLGRTALEWLLLLGSCVLVLVVELLNSAIEAVVDRIGHDLNELSARAKDMGSAAVLLSLLLAAATWLAVAVMRFGA